MKNFTSLLQLLREGPWKIVLIPHTHPDADALGSALALWRYLKKKDHIVSVISPSEYPKFLTWMEGHHRTLIFDKNNLKAIRYLEDADFVFCIDFSSLNRMGLLRERFEQSKARKVIIDHHPKPEAFAEFMLWSSRAAATAQLVYEFIRLDQGEDLLDTPIAECLYAGIVTDTGSFRFPSTSSRLHYITARLIEKGVEIHSISERLYASYSEARLRFIGYALSHCLHVYPEYHSAVFVLKEKDFLQFSPQNGDTEGLVNWGLSMKHIVVAILLKEQKGAVKLSFRSKGAFPVNEIARKYFNGGGHCNAAGGITEDSIQHTMDKLMIALKACKEEIATHRRT